MVAYEKPNKICPGLPHPHTPPPFPSLEPITAPGARPAGLPLSLGVFWSLGLGRPSEAYSPPQTYLVLWDSFLARRSFLLPPVTAWAPRLHFTRVPGRQILFSVVKLPAMSLIRQRWRSQISSPQRSARGSSDRQTLCHGKRFKSSFLGVGCSGLLPLRELWGQGGDFAAGAHTPSEGKGRSPALGKDLRFGGLSRGTRVPGPQQGEKGKAPETTLQ